MIWSARHSDNGKPMSRLNRFSRPVAIMLLPLGGFVFERSLAEPMTPFGAPSLYTLYVVCLLAFGVLSAGAERLSPTVASVAAGVLGTGCVVAGLVAVVGTLAALFTLFMSLVFPGDLPVGLIFALVFVSPWLTSIALGELAVGSFRASRGRIGVALTSASAIAGVALIVASMTLTKKADAAWLAPRLQVFDTNDIDAWETSLSEIKARWLCGHRRCLMDVCFKLMVRFGEGDGQSGPFASPGAMVVIAPAVPQDLAAPFEKVYGYPVRQVCVIGD